MDRNGDLGGYELTRQVFVWENLLAHITPVNVSVEERYLRRKKWDKALNLWKFDPVARRVLYRISWVRSLPVDIFTSHPAGYADSLRRWLDDSGYPYNRLINVPDDPDNDVKGLMEFTFSLARDYPEISTVWHSERRQPALAGGRGRLVFDPLQIQQALDG